jgi:hypothetical protein
LTNGEQNVTFRIKGDTATVVTMGAYRWSPLEREVMDTDAARALYAQGLKFGCRKGFTRHQAVRKLTTDAQYAAWARQAFDFDANDNDAEAELAAFEAFREQGFIEVPA